MDLGRKQWRQNLVDETVALQRLQTRETRGHDSQPKVPLAAGTGVARMRRAVVSHLQMSGLQMLLQQPLDAPGGRGRWAHEGCACRTSGRDASHAACSMANNAKAAVKPKNLKLTQSRSLR